MNAVVIGYAFKEEYADRSKLPMMFEVRYPYPDFQKAIRAFHKSINSNGAYIVVSMAMYKE